MLTTRFTRLIGCDVPIQQAGMGGVGTAELASAVALAGALGMIGGVRLGAKELGEQLDSLPQQVRSRIGLNFLIPFLDRESLEVAASRVRVVEFFYGEPDADLVERVHGAVPWRSGRSARWRKRVSAQESVAISWSHKGLRLAATCAAVSVCCRCSKACSTQ